MAGPDTGEVEHLAAVSRGVALRVALEQEGAELALPVAHVPGLSGEQLDARVPILRVDRTSLAACFSRSASAANAASEWRSPDFGLTADPELRDADGSVIGCPVVASFVVSALGASSFSRAS